jgi:hypothetical protein
MVIIIDSKSLHTVPVGVRFVYKILLHKSESSGILPNA